MPPNRFSRYSFVAGFQDADENFVLAGREPYRFFQYSDNITHRVGHGDTLFTLSAKYYAGMRRPAGFWWVIADFQPDPIIDPTIRLSVASTLFIPSMRTLVEDILDDARGIEALP